MLIRRSVTDSAVRARLPRVLSFCVAAGVLAALLAPVTATAAYRQSYAFLSKWTLAPEIQPDYARGISLTSDGNVVVSSHSNYVGVYSPTGTWQASLGIPLSDVFGSDGLETVDNVAVHGTDMWLVDSDQGVAKVDVNGTFLDVALTGIPGSPFDLSSGQGVAVDASGCVYVSDIGGTAHVEGFRVSKFTSSGAYVTNFGDTSSIQSNRLWSASSIAIGPHFEVYVADWLYGAVRVYKPTNAARTSYTLTATWKFGTLYEMPKAVATDVAGNVFVLDDTSPQRVTKLDPSGSVLVRWGSSAGTASDGVFANAWSLAVGADHTVFVNDRDDLSVQEFSLPDARPTTLASANLSVKKGKKVSFKYKAGVDVSPSVHVKIKVYKGSTLKATIDCGWVGQGLWHTKSWTCKLAKGKYTWKVYATDSTAQTQHNVAAKTLTVK